MEIVREDKGTVQFDAVPVGACFERGACDVYVRIHAISTQDDLRLNAVNLSTGYPVHFVSTTKVVPMYDMVLAHRSKVKE